MILVYVEVFYRADRAPLAAVQTCLSLFQRDQEIACFDLRSRDDVNLFDLAVHFRAMVVSIFIASSIISFCPATTWSPGFTATRTTRPGHCADLFRVLGICLLPPHIHTLRSSDR